MRRALDFLMVLASVLAFLAVVVVTALAYIWADLV